MGPCPVFVKVFYWTCYGQNLDTRVSCCSTITSPTVPPSVLHPIRVVSQRTGLSPDLVRAWERRYHVVRPRRSEGGQRLYSDADIEHLSNLHRAVLAGRPVGQVARLDRAALAELVASDAEDARGPSPAAVPDEPAGRIDAALQDALQAVELMDVERLARTLHRAGRALSVPLLLERLVAPLLREIGARWEDGRLQPIHERLASVEVHRFLTWLVETARVEPDAPCLAIATPAGQLMELGALMVGATAAAEGWRVAWLGPNLPAPDILLGVRTLRPDAVAISLVHQTRDPALHRELEAIARGLSGLVPLLVGGRAAPALALHLERHGAIVMTELAALRAWLDRHRR